MSAAKRVAKELEALQEVLPPYLWDLTCDPANVLEWHMLLLPESFLAVLRRPYEMLGIEPGSASFKTNPSPHGYSWRRGCLGWAGKGALEGRGFRAAGRPVSPGETPLQPQGLQAVRQLPPGLPAHAPTGDVQDPNLPPRRGPPQWTGVPAHHQPWELDTVHPHAPSPGSSQHAG